MTLFLQHLYTFFLICVVLGLMKILCDFTINFRFFLWFSERQFNFLFLYSLEMIFCFFKKKLSISTKFIPSQQFLVFSDPILFCFTLYGNTKGKWNFFIRCMFLVIFHLTLSSAIFLLQAVFSVLFGLSASIVFSFRMDSLSPCRRCSCTHITF